MRLADRTYPSRGGALVMTLVLLGLFVVMMIAATGLINTQFRATVDQEQEEQAFQIAEAGVNFVLWMLNTGLMDPNASSSFPMALSQDVKDQNTGEVMGRYDIAINVDTSGGSPVISLTSIGRPSTKQNRYQVIEAEIRSSSGGSQPYYISKWDHKPR